jgi:hypothetical protein
MAQLLYATELDAFDRLAPRDGDLGVALAALVERGGRAADPFAALGTLASRREGR